MGAFYYLLVVAFPFPFHSVILDTKLFVSTSATVSPGGKVSKYTMAGRNCSVLRTLVNDVYAGDEFISYEYRFSSRSDGLIKY